MQGRSAAVDVAARTRAAGYGARLRALADSRPYAAIAAIWLVWIGALVLVLAAGAATGASGTRHPDWPDVGGFLWPLFTWDYGWYLHIARDWYPSGTVDLRYAFFPLWPLVLRAADAIPTWVFAGSIVVVASGLAFAGLAAATPDRRRWRAPLALACWPWSFLLLLAYPDVIALAAAAWAAAFALRNRPILAGLAGAVAAVARPNGFLIALPLGLLALRRGPRHWLGAIFPLAAAAAVQAYFWQRSGDPRAFFRAESDPVWHRRGPGVVKTWVAHTGDALAKHALLVVIGAIVAAVVGWLLWRRDRRYGIAVAYAAVALGLLLGAQSTGTRVESARIAVVLPLLLVLWRLGSRYRPWALFAVAVVALSLGSGTPISFGRQALFAFPLVWAVLEGPPALRSRPLVVLAVAANVAAALAIPRFAP